MKNQMDVLRRMLQISPLAQLLLDGETVKLASPKAARLFPTVREGLAVEALLGNSTDEYRRFSGEGSMLFSTTVCGIVYDVTLTALEGYRLMTLSRVENAADTAELLAAAQQLRRPMTDILLTAPKLLPMVEETRETMEYTEILNRGVYGILRVTENMELYAREEQFIQRWSVSVENWLTELTWKLKPLCRAAGRQLSTEISGTLGYVQMDEDSMTKALLHLISNAIKFSAPGGTVTLSVAGRANCVRICVRDDGEGIPEDQMGSIFSRSRNLGLIPDPRWGAGLGLPVVRKLVQAHGGSLMIQSQTGKGTAVYLTLPARRSPDILTLRSPVMIPESSGMDPYLVSLSDVLPAMVFDTRDVDL